MMIPESFKPSPVSVKMPMMIPAAAVVATTERTCLDPISSARQSRRGVSAVSRRSQLSRKATTLAQKTAMMAVKPPSIKMTMVNSDVRW